MADKGLGPCPVSEMERLNGEVLDEALRFPPGVEDLICADHSWP